MWCIKFCFEQFRKSFETNIYLVTCWFGWGTLLLCSCTAGSESSWCARAESWCWQSWAYKQIRSTPDPQHTPTEKTSHPQPTFGNVSFCFGDKACCDIFGFCRSYSIHCTLQKDLIKGEEIRLAIEQKSLKKPDTRDLMSSKKELELQQCHCLEKTAHWHKDQFWNVFCWCIFSRLRAHS